jgi:hypothetical protein
MSLMRMVCISLRLKVVSVMRIVCLPQAISVMEKACTHPYQSHYLTTLDVLQLAGDGRNANYIKSDNDSRK